MNRVVIPQTYPLWLVQVYRADDIGDADDLAALAAEPFMSSDWLHLPERIIGWDVTDPQRTIPVTETGAIRPGTARGVGDDPESAECEAVSIASGKHSALRARLGLMS